MSHIFAMCGSFKVIRASHERLDGASPKFACVHLDLHSGDEHLGSHGGCTQDAVGV